MNLEEISELLPKSESTIRKHKNNYKCLKFKKSCDCRLDGSVYDIYYKGKKVGLANYEKGKIEGMYVSAVYTDPFSHENSGLDFKKSL